MRENDLTALAELGINDQQAEALRQIFERNSRPGGMPDPARGRVSNQGE